MITRFKIKNFKCFNEFEIDNLSQINILLGESSVGKSTLLEAIFGYACGKNDSVSIEHILFRQNRDSNQNLYSLVEKVLNSFYSIEDLEFTFEADIVKENENITKKYTYKINPGSIFVEVEPKMNKNIIFNNEEIGAPIVVQDINNIRQQIPQKFLFQLDLEENNQNIKSKKVFYPLFTMEPSNEEPFLMANILNSLNFKSLAHLNRIYSVLKRKPEEFRYFLAELNKAFKNEIKDIDMFPYPDGTLAPISIKNSTEKFIPIYEYGEGLQKGFCMLGNQFVFQNSIHCIEEIGDMLHPSAQGVLGVNLSKLAEKNNNQIFATTQSLEFLTNYLLKVSENNKELLNKIRVITLKRIDDDIRARVIDGEKALKLIVDNGLELR